MSTLLLPKALRAIHFSGFLLLLFYSFFFVFLFFPCFPDGFSTYSGIFFSSSVSVLVCPCFFCRDSQDGALNDEVRSGLTGSFLPGVSLLFGALFSYTISLLVTYSSIYIYTKYRCIYCIHMERD